MEKHANKKHLVPGFIIVVFLISISSTFIGKNIMVFKSSLENSDSPISIAGDMALVSLGLPGSGTIGDPYRIENNTIIMGTPGISAISISSTHIPLLIRNCTISNSSGLAAAGIFLSYCTNITIENCTIFSNQKGIYLSFSQRNAIISNNISKNSGGTGIYFEGSHDNNITRNTIHENRQGINLITSSQKNNIYINSFQGNAAGDYAWDGTGSGNTWFLGVIGNYWANYKANHAAATTTDHVTWNIPYVLNQTKNQVDAHPLVSFTIIHPPFIIDSNAKLLAFTEKAGSGTVVDPFVIKDMLIGAESGVSCIQLQNINLHLKLFNITAFGGNAGIWLGNCTNCTVDHCKSSFNSQGCHVESQCSNFTISNSNFSRNTNHGIYMENAVNWSMITDYVGYNAKDGIHSEPTC